MKSRYYTIGLLALFLSLHSCTVTRTWTYTPSKTNESKSSKKNVNIKLFTDNRSEKDKGNIWMGYIPLMPLGWENTETPEKKYSSSWTFDPVNDYTKALETEMRTWGDFNSVSIVAEQPKSGIIIEGTILSTSYDSKLFTYGVSLLAGIPWFIGAPTGSFKNMLRLELKASDASTGTELFKKEYESIAKKIYWVYKTPNDFKYSDLLQGIYQEFRTDLRNSKVYE